MTAELAGYLGPGASFTGDLAFQGRVRVDGTLRGDVRSDDLVDVTADGVVVGTVRAPQVLVSGQVTGGIEATERVTLLETARVQGRIVAPWLDVRTGARVRAEVVVQRA